MDNKEFDNIFKSDVELVEKAIIGFLPKSKNGQDEVVEAMRYSLLNGGKRLRPVFCLEFANCFGVSKKRCACFCMRC